MSTSRYETLEGLLRRPGTRLAWVRPDTRWDVHPRQRDAELAMYSRGAWWLPCPDGRWFRSPVALVVDSEAHGPALLGAWVSTPIPGFRCHGKELTVTSFRRAPGGVTS